MSTTIEQIKARLSIVDIVGSYLKLEKAGSNFKACCPFHNEKTPSFVVSPNRDSYHCFGCNKGGDIFSFVQEMEGLEFVDTLKMLADRAGVTLERQATREPTGEKDRLFGILLAATRWYQGALERYPNVREYLLERGLTEATIAEFGIGYVPEAWRSIYTYLREQGYTDEEITKAGLIVKAEASGSRREVSYYDRFRNRAMFPIADSAGRVTGFSGRIFPSAGAGQAVEVAKYINTPQTLVYDKSKALYGIDKAKNAIRQANMCVLVEGQIDLVLSHQVGVKNAVAVSGTALTEDHLRFIRRFADTLVMAFDGDGAGIRAAKRAVDMALALGFEVKIAELPVGQDPADCIVKDANSWIKAVTEAAHVIDFYLQVLVRREKDKRQLALAVSAEVLPYVAKLANQLDQAYFVKKISELISLPEEPVWREVEKHNRSQTQTGPSVRSDAAPPPKEMISRKEKIVRGVLGIAWWQESIAEQVEKSRKLLDQVGALVGPLIGVIEGTANLKNQLIAEAEFKYDDMAAAEKAAIELCRELQAEVLRQELAKTMQLLKEAEKRGDAEALDLYLKKCQDISNQLRQANISL